MSKKIFLSGVLLFLLLVTNFYRATAQTPDPGIPGSHTVVKAEYDLGDAAYTPPITIFPVAEEVIGCVYYPSDLSNGPYPVIEILHGRHSTCWETSDPSNTSSEWPCPTGWQPIPSYEGYGYLDSNMASHGYIVISISANAINANDGSVAASYEDGMPARGDLMQYHLNLWNTWNTVGGFPGNDSLFIGALNMQNIGTMGHSRGGEGAIFNALQNRRLGSPYGINAVFTLAPIDFYDSILNRTPLLDVAPYCDGDVNDLEGVHFYDDARYNDTTDYAPKHEILYMGADHDYFNTVWTPPTPGGVDDWTYSYSETAAWCGTNAVGSGRLDSTQQTAALLPYFAAFFRVYIGHESQFAPILDVDDTIPPASSGLNSTQVHVSFHPSRLNRLDINRTDSTDRLTTNTLGGSVTQDSLLSSQVCGGGTSFGETDCGVTSPYTQAKQPHNSNSTSLGLSQIGMQWDTSVAWYQNDLPSAYENLSGYQDILFRASVNYEQTLTDSNLNFTVQLIDSAGDTSSVAVASYSNVLFYQPGTQHGDLPKLLFNTVKIPLSDFTGIDLTTVQSVRFLFNQSQKGSVFVSDLAFSNTPCSGITASFTDSISGEIVTFTNTTSANTTDSITWYWNFGDTTSGTNDTSTLQSPTHTYSGYGSYTPCLYVMDYRKNGFICTDTLCNSIGVFPLAVPKIAGKNITIIPNPASDHLYITGAANTDILTLLDMYGQVVFTTTIASPAIQLPQNLPTGIYNAVITTNTGKVYQKLLISQ